MAAMLSVNEETIKYMEQHVRVLDDDVADEDKPVGGYIVLGKVGDGDASEGENNE